MVEAGSIALILLRDGLVYAHVIHVVVCGKLSVERDRPGEDATDCQVQDQIEGFIEDPFPVSNDVRGKRVIVLTIEIPADAICIPLDSVGVEIVGDVEFLGIPAP